MFTLSPLLGLMATLSAVTTTIAQPVDTVAAAGIKVSLEDFIFSVNEARLETITMSYVWDGELVPCKIEFYEDPIIMNPEWDAGEHMLDFTCLGTPGAKASLTQTLPIRDKVDPKLTTGLDITVSQEDDPTAGSYTFKTISMFTDSRLDCNGGEVPFTCSKPDAAPLIPMTPV